MPMITVGGSRAPQFDYLTVGQETLPRELAQVMTAATTNGTLRLHHFTARRSFTSTQARVWSGATAAVTPTLIRWGLYSVSPTTGDLTLEASIPNDITLFAAAATAYTRSWSAPVSLVAGQRYAHGVVVVGSATAPTLMGAVASGTLEPLEAPRIHGAWGGQTDLPATVLPVNVSASASRHYAAILP